MSNKLLIAVTFLYLLVPLYVCSEELNKNQVHYELKLIYIFEGQEPEFIFTVGNTGFKSVESLKQFLGNLPPGSQITWSPGCLRMGKEPLLSSERELKEFLKYLEEKGLKLNVIPSG